MTACQPCEEAPETSLYLVTKLLKEVSKKGHRIAAERDRAMFEGRAILRKYDEEKHKRGMTQDTFIRTEKETMDSQSHLQY